ncbi:MerR family transcriptional regulator [Enterococcus sp.]|uniref:MerR family transcriptional regulator n=1 Tax=Enterococcus sp. TaxID=35783 RepID=UPI00290CED40|nr:MerR family transcriptional regulator [Enterococcus sp.]MDU5334559.1 MerR family transcriptional regulator [Enterococcus sp.]
MNDNKLYHPIDLARMFDVHPNTIRLYEKSSFISKAERNKNGYREFTELHVLQLQICRRIFGYPFTKRHIRDTGNDLLHSIADQDWSLSRSRYENYIEAIRQEIIVAEYAGKVLHEWSKRKKDLDKKIAPKRYSRKDVAERFGVTVEAVRNWERNGLVHAVPLETEKQVVYSGDMIDRFYVIYMLRQAGYSISAIHRSMRNFDQREPNNVLSSLHQPDQDELISVGDRWLYELKKLERNGTEIPAIIDRLMLLKSENP